MVRTSPFHGEDFTGSSPVRDTHIHGVFSVMASISDCGSDGFGSNPKWPPFFHVGLAEWFRHRSAKPLRVVRFHYPTL